MEIRLAGLGLAGICGRHRPHLFELDLRLAVVARRNFHHARPADQHHHIRPARQKQAADELAGDLQFPQRDGLLHELQRGPGFPVLRAADPLHLIGAAIHEKVPRKGNNGQQAIVGVERLRFVFPRAQQQLAVPGKPAAPRTLGTMPTCQSRPCNVTLPCQKERTARLQTSCEPKSYKVMSASTRQRPEAGVEIQVDIRECLGRSPPRPRQTPRRDHRSNPGCDSSPGKVFAPPAARERRWNCWDRRRKSKPRE